jgi:hypothetical protein
VRVRDNARVGAGALEKPEEVGHPLFVERGIEPFGHERQPRALQRDEIFP